MFECVFTIVIAFRSPSAWFKNDVINGRLVFFSSVALLSYTDNYWPRVLLSRLHCHQIVSNFYTKILGISITFRANMSSSTFQTLHGNTLKLKHTSVENGKKKNLWTEFNINISIFLSHATLLFFSCCVFIQSSQEELRKSIRKRMSEWSTREWLSFHPSSPFTVLSFVSRQK